MFYSSANILILLVVSTNAAFLPDYFKRCSLTNRNLNKCLTKNAIEAWPIIVEGDKDVHLQTLDPLSVPFLRAIVNNRFFGNLSNAIITGLADMKIDEIKLDHNKQIFDLYFLIPSFNIWGQYDVKGELINLQLEGHGIINNTYHNLNTHLQIEYELIEKKDQHYINPVKNTFSYNITLLDVHMDNLANNINEILNENWESLNNEISNAFSDLFGELFTEILKPFFRKVSYEELFSDVEYF